MKHFITDSKYRKIRLLIVIAFWIAIWQLVSMGLPQLLFAGPAEVLCSLIRLLGRADSWRTAGGSMLRVAAGFFAAFFCGNLLAVMGYKMQPVREIAEPVMSLIKTVPVASFIIVALIWVSSRNVSILISFVVVFPISYVNMLEGLKNMDKKLLEMADIFRIGRGDRLKYIYPNQVLPFVISGCRVSVGMCWKAGIAGEIIGRPEYSIGDMLYKAKLYLDTGDLFAWTVIIILLGVIFEKCVLLLLKLVQKCAAA